MALRDGEPVGRIVAVENKGHNKYYGDRVGFFGFFDFIDDKEVSRALFEAASTELKRRGLTSIRGPYSPTVNDECGLLVEGFESAPFVMMPFNPPYYLEHFEALGLDAARDLFAFYISSSEKPSDRIIKIVERIKKSSGLSLRSIDMKRLDQELVILHRLYNETLDRNWGFVPLELEDLQSFAKEFKSIAAPEMVMIAEKKGEPIGFSLVLPNINEFLWRARSDRRWLRALKVAWWLMTSHPKEARLAIMGVRKEFRNSGIGALFYLESLQRGKNRYIGGELSWIDENNKEIIHGMTLMGARCYKKYRIFERSV